MVLQWIVYGLWQIWKSRNGAIFEGKKVCPTEAMQLWQAQVQEFQESQHKPLPLASEQPGPLDQGQTVSLSWQKPKLGWIKINCDGAWKQQTLRGGVGWVVRSHFGFLLMTGGTGNMLCQ
ncbi:hypothetical protein CerSpe_268760 [Prunus speciosa]